MVAYSTLLVQTQHRRALYISCRTGLSQSIAVLFVNSMKAREIVISNYLKSMKLGLNGVHMLYDLKKKWTFR